MFSGIGSHVWTPRAPYSPPKGPVLTLQSGKSLLSWDLCVDVNTWTLENRAYSNYCWSPLSSNTRDSEEGNDDSRWYPQATFEQEEGRSIRNQMGNIFGFVGYSASFVTTQHLAGIKKSVIDNM